MFIAFTDTVSKELLEHTARCIAAVVDGGSLTMLREGAAAGFAGMLSDNDIASVA